jgi:hypothetical protein
MGQYPTSPRSTFLAWCQAHAPVFAANAGEIGISEAQASSFAAAATMAANKILAQDQKRDEYRLAVTATSDAFGDLRRITGEVVRAVKSYAEQQAKPNLVYQLAQINPPAPPSPAPPPGKPDQFTVEIVPTSGALTIRWKCANPPGTSGTSYIVRRRVQGENQFTFIWVTGTKFYTDAGFSAGPDRVEYTVQGARAGTTGPVSNILVVNFGAGGGGGFQVFASDGGEAEAPKLAA